MRSGTVDKRLNVFAGKWNTEGQQHEGPVGPAAKITATETYEWLTGNAFLVHRFEGRVGDGEAACIEIIGPDAGNQGYPAHTYYNNGVTNEWHYEDQGNTWVLTGKWAMAGQETKVRCTIVFSDGGNTMTGAWESSPDGTSWQSFWDVRATRAK